MTDRIALKKKKLNLTKKKKRILTKYEHNNSQAEKEYREKHQVLSLQNSY